MSIKQKIMTIAKSKNFKFVKKILANQANFIIWIVSLYSNYNIFGERLVHIHAMINAYSTTINYELQHENNFGIWSICVR